jgi:hypothetical protein
MHCERGLCCRQARAEGLTWTHTHTQTYTALRLSIRPHTALQ